TPAYMAPERLRGGRGDARSDQFSFCVAMWRGLYGRRPFAGDEPDELLESIEGADLRADPDVEVPRWLTEVGRRGLAVNPEDRNRDMRELAAQLDERSADSAVLGRVAGAVKDVSDVKQATRERWPYFAMAFLTSVVVVMGAMLTRPS